MTSVALVPYRSLLKPALLTAAASLAAFGLAHVAFITWVPTPSQLAGEPQPPLGLRVLVLFVAPMMIGVPFALAAAALGAAAWRVAGPRMGGWRYGAALASAFVPPVALSLARGPYGDATPGGLAVFALIAAVFLLPASVGAALGGMRAGAMVAASALPLALPWSFFLLGAGMVGWVVPFVVSLFVILVGAGVLMGRLAPRQAPDLA